MTESKGECKIERVQTWKEYSAAIDTILVAHPEWVEELLRLRKSETGTCWGGCQGVNSGGMALYNHETNVADFLRKKHHDLMDMYYSGAVPPSSASLDMAFWCHAVAKTVFKNPTSWMSDKDLEVLWQTEYKTWNGSQNNERERKRHPLQQDRSGCWFDPEGTTTDMAWVLQRVMRDPTEKRKREHAVLMHAAVECFKKKRPFDASIYSVEWATPHWRAPLEAWQAFAQRVWSSIDLSAFDSDHKEDDKGQACDVCHAPVEPKHMWASNQGEEMFLACSKACLQRLPMHVSPNHCAECGDKIDEKTRQTPHPKCTDVYCSEDCLRESGWERCTTFSRPPSLLSLTLDLFARRKTSKRGHVPLEPVLMLVALMVIVVLLCIQIAVSTPRNNNTNDARIEHALTRMNDLHWVMSRMHDSFTELRQENKDVDARRNVTNGVVKYDMKSTHEKMNTLLARNDTSTTAGFNETLQRLDKLESKIENVSHVAAKQMDRLVARAEVTAIFVICFNVLTLFAICLFAICLQPKGRT